MNRLILIVTTLLYFNLSVFTDDIKKSKQAVVFSSKKITVEMGETFVIPFSIKSKAKEKSFFHHKVDHKHLNVLYSPCVLKGYSIGYLRLKALKAGTSSLTVGSSTLIVQVQSSKKVFSFFDGSPLIITPINGAVVNGEISIGVKVLDNQSNFKELSKRLHLEINGQSISPDLISPLADSPTRIILYTFDTTSLPTGDIIIKASMQAAQKKLTTSVKIQKAQNSQKENSLFECEDQVSIEKRLEKWGKELPKLGSSPDVSGNKFVVNYSAKPVSVHEVNIKGDGFYQFFARVRGDRAGGAYPTIGIYVDGENDAADMGRSIASRWHRISIGNPLYLKKGSRQIALRFMNDFATKGRIDRNLFLDYFEITKVHPSGMNKSLGLQVAFQNNFHENIARSDMRIPAIASWNKKNHRVPPRVTLEVNGVEVSSMVASEPVFYLERDQLKAGVNRLKLLASFEAASGTTTSTTQTVICKDVKPMGKKGQTFFEYRIHDKSWKTPLLGLLEHKKRYSETVKLTENQVVTLNLPDELEGEFEVLVNTRAGNKKQAFTGQLTINGAVTLKAPAKEKIITGWWRHVSLGKCTLKKGEKSLTVQFSKEKNKASIKPLYLRGLVLKRLRKKADRNPPMISVVYPNKGTVLRGDEVIVIRISEDRNFSEANLFVNGKNYSQTKRQQNGFGFISFVLPKNIMPDGKSDLMIRVTDKAGNIGESRHVSYHRDGDTKVMNPYKRAVHLSKRLGYGAGLQDVTDILVKGEATWLNEQLELSEQSAGVATSLDLTHVRYRNRFDYNMPSLTAISHLAKTQGPVRGRFVMWAENHFSTWVNKVKPQTKIEEHQTFSKQGIGKFKDLLYSSAFSPAMINYLDQHRSFAGKLNENYARELLELHTLSVEGGYQQEDVTKLASLLNGWMTSDEAGLSGGSIRNASFYYFSPALNDGKPYDICGVHFSKATGPQKFDRILMMLEMLSSHPSTAKFIVKKLVAHYTGDKGLQDKALLARLEVIFSESGGDMRSLLKEIVASKTFWETSDKVYTPLDFSIALERNRESPNIWAILNCAKKSGVGLYDRATPDGYPEGNRHYADSNSLLQRWRFCEQIKWNLNVNIPSSLHQKRGLEEETWSHRVVQIAAMNMLGISLEKNSLKASCQYLVEVKGRPWEKVLKLATFIGKLPEANIR